MHHLLAGSTKGGSDAVVAHGRRNRSGKAIGRSGERLRDTRGDDGEARVLRWAMPAKLVMMPVDWHFNAGLWRFDGISVTSCGIPGFPVSIEIA